MRYWITASVIGFVGFGTVLAEPPGVQTVRATGVARAPQKYQGARARLMAERGAQVVAARNLAARVAQGQGNADLGPQGSGYSKFAGTIRGHRYSPTIHHPDGTAEVTAKVDLPVQTSRSWGYPHSSSSVKSSGNTIWTYSSTVYPNNASSITTIRQSTVSRYTTIAH